MLPPSVWRMGTTKLEPAVMKLANQSATPVSISHLIQLADRRSVKALINNARFLHRELPIRLARRVYELQSLPYGLPEMASVIRVVETYRSSIDAIQSCKVPSTSEQNDAFCDLLADLYNHHHNVLPLMAQGISEMRSTRAYEVSTGCPFLKDFLDRFFLARIGIRVLASHHLALHDCRPGYQGVFKLDTDVRKVLDGAVEDATEVCDRYYGESPEVKIFGGVDLKLPYIPTHLHYCIFELLKNSMRATVENPKHSGHDLPPIEVVIAEGTHDVAIKVSDIGGGIRRQDIPCVWQYAFTTAKFPDDLDVHGSVAAASSASAPMAGLGYGLPLSRLYARSFGGDLTLISMDGHGTDAYLHLSSVDGVELVPE